MGSYRGCKVLGSPTKTIRQEGCSSHALTKRWHRIWHSASRDQPWCKTSHGPNFSSARTWSADSCLRSKLPCPPKRSGAFHVDSAGRDAQLHFDTGVDLAPHHKFASHERRTLPHATQPVVSLAPLARENGQINPSPVIAHAQS